MQMQSLVEMSRIIQKFLAELIPFLLTGDLINTPPCAYHGPFQCKWTPRRRPSAPWLRGVPLASRKPFFCGDFYGARLKAKRGDIEDSPWKMDHENVTIHFPLSNYVIKMISGEHDGRLMNAMNVNFSNMHGMLREIDDV